jgi:hypothetical protein
MVGFIAFDYSSGIRTAVKNKKLHRLEKLHCCRFGLHGECRDCASDDLAACATAGPLAIWKLEKGGDLTLAGLISVGGTVGEPIVKLESVLGTNYAAMGAARNW